MEERKVINHYGDWKHYPYSNWLFERGIKPGLEIDKDQDGIVDWEDCDPYDINKQGIWKSIKKTVGKAISKVKKVVSKPSVSTIVKTIVKTTPVAPVTKAIVSVAKKVSGGGVSPIVSSPPPPTVAPPPQIIPTIKPIYSTSGKLTGIESGGVSRLPTVAEKLIYSKPISGTYYAKSGVYITPSGQGISTTTPPSGARIVQTVVPRPTPLPSQISQVPIISQTTQQNIDRYKQSLNILLQQSLQNEIKTTKNWQQLSPIEKEKIYEKYNKEYLSNVQKYTNQQYIQDLKNKYPDYDIKEVKTAEGITYKLIPKAPTQKEILETGGTMIFKKGEIPVSEQKGEILEAMVPTTGQKIISYGEYLLGQEIGSSGAIAIPSSQISKPYIDKIIDKVENLKKDVNKKGYSPVVKELITNIGTGVWNVTGGFIVSAGKGILYDNPKRYDNRIKYAEKYYPEGEFRDKYIKEQKKYREDAIRFNEEKGYSKQDLNALATLTIAGSLSAIGGYAGKAVKLGFKGIQAYTGYQFIKEPTPEKFGELVGLTIVPEITERGMNSLRVRKGYNTALKELELKFGKNSQQVNEFKILWKRAFVELPRDVPLTKEWTSKDVEVSINNPRLQKITEETIKKYNPEIVGSTVITPQTTLKAPPRIIAGDIDVQNVPLIFGRGTRSKKMSYELYNNLRKAGYNAKIRVTIFNDYPKYHITIDGKEFINVGSSSDYFLKTQAGPLLNWYEFKRFGAWKKTPSGIKIGNIRDQMRVKLWKGFVEKSRAKDITDAKGIKEGTDYLFHKAPTRAKSSFNPNTINKYYEKIPSEIPKNIYNTEKQYYSDYLLNVNKAIISAIGTAKNYQEKIDTINNYEFNINQKYTQLKDKYQYTMDKKLKDVYYNIGNKFLNYKNKLVKLKEKYYKEKPKEVYTGLYPPTEYQTPKYPPTYYPSKYPPKYPPTKYIPYPLKRQPIITEKPIKLMLPKIKQKPTKKVPITKAGYYVLVKPVRAKEFQVYNPDIPLSENRAKDVGAYYVFSNLSRTFKIQKAEKPRKPDYKYLYIPEGFFKRLQFSIRPYKIRKGKAVQIGQQFIQKGGASLSSIAERRQIQSFRKQQQDFQKQIKAVTGM